MRTKTILLGSVSAIATAAAGAGHAQAAITTSENGYTFSVQGGLAMTPAEMSLAGVYDEFNSGGGIMGKFGSGYATLDDLDQAFGYNAAVSIGKDLGNGWDIRMGASTNATGESSGFVSAYNYGSGSGYSGGTSGYSGSGWSNAYVSETEKFSFQALDFEVGYTPVLSDGLTVRLFGGIRAVHSLYEQSYGSGFQMNFEQSGFSAGGYASGAPSFPFIGLSGFSGADGYSGASGWFEHSAGFDFQGVRQVKTEFFGAGPRVGIDVSKRLDGTNFGLSGRLAGSVLFGKQTVSWTESYSGSFSGSGAMGYYSGADRTTTSSYSSGSSFYDAESSSYSVDKKIGNIEAQVGLDYYLDDSTALTIGYQAEKFIDLDDEGPNHLTHGAFVKLTGSF